MELIYEKHYPHPSFEDKMRELEEYKRDLESQPDYQPEPVKPFEEFYREMVENRTLILLPDIIVQAEDFIKLAVEVAELYEFDTTIKRKDSHIEVNYSFDCGGELDYLTPIIGQADSISFFAGIHGFEITLSLDFYTHAVYDKGRLLHPKPLI